MPTAAASVATIFVSSELKMTEDTSCDEVGLCAGLCDEVGLCTCAGSCDKVGLCTCAGSCDEVGLCAGSCEEVGLYVRVSGKICSDLAMDGWSPSVHHQRNIMVLEQIVLFNMPL